MSYTVTEVHGVDQVVTVYGACRTNRANSGVLVIDAQNGILANVYRRDATVAAIGRFVDQARAARIPVFWIQDIREDRVPGTEPWQIVPELHPGDDELRINKFYGDSFEDTNLEAILASRGIGQLFLVGAETDACIRSTLHGALVRGYDTVLVGDAHTTSDLTEWGAPSPEAVISHTNLYWHYNTTAPGRTARVIATADIRFTN